MAVVSGHSTVVHTAAGALRGDTEGGVGVWRGVAYAARRGELSPIPLIVGTNSHEASMFTWAKPPMLPTTRGSAEAYFTRVGPGVKERLGGRKLHPLGRRLPPRVGRRMQCAWLDFASADSVDDSRWPVYETRCRRTRLIMSARDAIVEDPDAVRRAAWAGMY